jgi:multidrug resistance efflux pump
MTPGRTALGSVAAAAAFALLTGCAATPATGIVVTGTVEVSTTVVAAPILAVAVANPTVGFPTTHEAPPTTDAASLLGLGQTVRIASVAVREGDHVTAGQVVATTDPGTLEAELAIVKADKQAAKAQVDVLAAAIEETWEKAQTVEENRDKVDDAIQKLTGLKGDLSKALRKLKAMRPQLVAKLREAEQLLANYPPVPPPGIPTPEQLKEAIAQLKAGIRKIDKGIRTIEAAQPKLKEGLAKARDGRRKLDDAAATITDVREQLTDARELAKIAAEASQIPVDLARAQVSLTELTAPVAGVVTSVAGVGDQLAAGASVVGIRPDGPSQVTAWLSPAQAAQVCRGDAARIRGDWMPAGAGVAASLTRLADSYQYPPTDVTTDEIHLTRALEVEFTATTEQLPAGVPVDITITGCNPAATADQTNG